MRTRVVRFAMLAVISMVPSFGAPPAGALAACTITDAILGLMSGTPGNDVLCATADTTTVNGFGGDDVIRLAGGDVDVVTAGGNDTLDFSNAPGGVVVDLASGIASGYGTVTFNSIENVIGSSAGDKIVGDADANVLEGRGGNDVLIGGGGSDVLKGGAGSDRLVGSSGNDRLLGGKGADWADFTDATQGVTADLAAGTATGVGSDTMKGIEHILGSGFGDTLRGNGKANVLKGRGGDDVLRGGDGRDTLYGNAGNDAMNGGAGRDTCNGGPGRDTKKSC